MCNASHKAATTDRPVVTFKHLAPGITLLDDNVALSYFRHLVADRMKHVELGRDYPQRWWRGLEHKRRLPTLNHQRLILTDDLESIDRANVRGGLKLCGHMEPSRSFERSD
jgi:hypothetical protein